MNAVLAPDVTSSARRLPRLRTSTGWSRAVGRVGAVGALVGLIFTSSAHNSPLVEPSAGAMAGVLESSARPVTPEVGPPATATAESAVPEAPAAAAAPSTAGSTATDSSPSGPSSTPPLGTIAAGAAGVALGGAVLSGDAARADIPVEQFGAFGDGVHDDTAALQKALDSVPTGSQLRLRAGATYLHSDVLVLRTPGVTITGVGATVTATKEARSAFHVTADRVTVTGVTFALASSTKRFDAPAQDKIRVWGDDVVLRDVHVRGAAAAGVFIDGSARFLLDRVTVDDSRADGIHISNGATDGQVLSPVTSRTGDDGVAVVSYKTDGVQCARVRIVSPRVNGTTWGRGISVVGGDDITYTDIDVRDTDAAGVYIGSEGNPYYTFPSRRVTVDGGTVTGANTNADKDHGAVLVYAGNAGTQTEDVTVRGLTIAGTRSTATWELGVLADAGAALQRISLSDITITGGAKSVFYAPESLRAAVRLTGVRDDGTAVADRSGW